jgi:UDP-N-acetylmuramoyl-L-alanyl-D-glutamate--2,6-diaminopimelate ligase
VDNYFAAKASLFTPERIDQAVIRVDDQWGQKLVQLTDQAGVKTLALTCPTEHPVSGQQVRHHPQGIDQIIQVTDIQVLPTGGSSVKARTPWGEWVFEVGMPGEHNVANAAMALGLVKLVGLDPVPAFPALRAMTVPGRLQTVDLPLGPKVYVDFAHTPEAIDSTLETLRHQLDDDASSSGGRLIAVFGAGGDRDQSKRPLMGAAAMRWADQLIVTDDNARTEDPAGIRAQVISGAQAIYFDADSSSPQQRAVTDGGDRRSAIRMALEMATEKDVVAVLGRGHEKMLDCGGVQEQFDDAEVIGEQWRQISMNRN